MGENAQSVCTQIKVTRKVQEQNISALPSQTRKDNAPRGHITTPTPQPFTLSNVGLGLSIKSLHATIKTFSIFLAELFIFFRGKVLDTMEVTLQQEASSSDFISSAAQIGSQCILFAKAQRCKLVQNSSVPVTQRRLFLRSVE